MAVYRSDQAQLTFAAESAQGADAELMEGTVTGTRATATLESDCNAGARTITIDVITSAAFVVGDFIRIGTVDGTPANTYIEHEVRRIEAIDGTQQVDTSPGNTITLLLDRPAAFFHATDEVVKEVILPTSGEIDGTQGGPDTTRNDRAKYITFIPGVYDTVDTPDPEMSFEGRRFLSTASKRNWSVAYPGQQTLTGSVSGIILLNGWPLRFPLGSITTAPQTKGGVTALLYGAAKKGDIFIRIDNGSGSAVSAISTQASNGGFITIDDTSSTVQEVRRLVQAVVNTTYYKLNYPLQFDHDDNASVDTCDADGGDYFDHTIIEKVDLDTVSWHVKMRDSSETASKDFDRRYVGGMVGSTTIAADEGGMVTVSWDGVNFLNMIHNPTNQKTVAASAGDMYYGASIAANMPRFGLMQTIDTEDVGRPGANNSTGYPVDQPYYFSQGTIKFFGTEFARIRNFNLSISNGEEPRYYLGRQGNRARGPYEIHEGPRDYSMSCTVTLPDADATATASAATSGQDSALALFRQLLLEGDYGDPTAAATSRAGFTASLKFERGANDYIIIDIPGSTTAGTPTAAANQLNSQGIFINTAQHAITGDNPMQVDVSMIFRGLNIYIRDQEPVYP